MAARANETEVLRFLEPEQVFQVRARFGTPVYVYSASALRLAARTALSFPNTYGLTVRFAMKACSTKAVLQLLSSEGICIDASSGFEVRRAMLAGIPAGNISLSTQELPADFAELAEMGVCINCCSLSQLQRYGQALPGSDVGVRFNPGLGSGGTAKTNVGGPASSFGVWHHFADQVASLAAEHRLRIVRIHTHIGSGSDPEVWQRVVGLSLALVRQFPQVATLNLGGGFKVARTLSERSTELHVVGAPVRAAFEAFAAETGRCLALEIEPGTFLLANAASLVTTVQDKVSTGAEGHVFLKLDAGMTEIIRPSLYGAQHPTIIVPEADSQERREREGAGLESALVVGHCCESGDLITCAPDEGSVLQERQMVRAEIGAVCVVEGVGAYCGSFAAKHYNSYPEAPEVMLEEDGSMRLIRRRSTLEQMVQNEL